MQRPEAEESSRQRPKQCQAQRHCDAKNDQCENRIWPADAISGSAIVAAIVARIFEWRRGNYL